MNTYNRNKEEKKTQKITKEKICGRFFVVVFIHFNGNYKSMLPVIVSKKSRICSIRTGVTAAIERAAHDNNNNNKKPSKIHIFMRQIPSMGLNVEYQLRAANAQCH